MHHLRIPPSWREMGVRRDIRLTRWLFLRGLGLVYLTAFASFAAQVKGLIGSRGILPAEFVFQSARHRAFWQNPSIFWLNASDPVLVGACIAGVILSLLLAMGLIQRISLMVLYVLYLSLVTAGQDFMAFQWDILLLEAGFLAIFLSPPNLGLRPPRDEAPPPRLAIYAFHVLLFRLMFGSGLVKLKYNDPTWHNLTALSYHYWTQPIPNPIAWYANLLPMWADKAATLIALSIELPVPFLYFGTRGMRAAAAALTVFLQLFIMLTGNFAFFNLLTIALCLPLLDDDHLRRFIPARWAWLQPGGVPVENAPPAEPSRDTIALESIWRGLATGVSAILILIGALMFTAQAWRPIGPSIGLLRAVYPFGISSTYGLFATMTTERPELVIEGSMDGETWIPYEFRYKPGDLREAPPFVAPHQPRLDWQMWFAALSGPGGTRWMEPLLYRLMTGEPDVLALLEENPFPDAPPRYIRVMMYQYTFTDWQTRRETGQWWQRGEPTPYYLPVSLEESGG